MKAKSLIIICLTLLTLSAATAPGQEAPGLRVEIRAHASRLILGEPLFVELSVTNAGGQIQQVVPAYAPGALVVAISADGVNFAPYMDRFRGLGLTDARELGPGETYSMQITVFARLQPMDRHKLLHGDFRAEYLWVQPGAYHVRGQYSRIHSEPLAIQVVAPGPRDAVLWAELKDNPHYGLLIHLMRSVPDAALQRFKQIITEHPDSVYSQYLALALAKHYRQRTREVGRPADDPVRADARQQEIRYFKLASEMKQVPAVREEALLRYGGILFRDKQLEQSRRVAEQGLREFPDGRLRDSFEALLEESIEPSPILPIGHVQSKLRKEGLEVLSLDRDTLRELGESVTAAVEADIRAGNLTARRRNREIARRYEQAVRAVLARDLPPPASD
jgi:hypothetical protein